MNPLPRLYKIRLEGHLGATALSAFPTMVPQREGRETVLTGLLEDRAALFGLLGEIEALGLEITELRRVVPPESPGSGDDRSPELSRGSVSSSTDPRQLRSGSLDRRPTGDESGTDGRRGLLSDRT
jgi:hypothetical protein